MHPLDYAALVAQMDSEQSRQVRAALCRHGLGNVRSISNPPSGRDDGVTPTRTAVVICEDECGERVCVKFYEDSDQGQDGLRGHARCLRMLHGVIPVSEIVGVEQEAGRFGLPALVTTYIGESLDRATATITGSARLRLAGDVGQSVATLANLDIREQDFRAPGRGELRQAVARMLAEDAKWYVEHAPANGEARDLVLRGAALLANAEVSVGAPSLCHRDLAASNVMVRDGAFSGITDWDHAGVDAPERDLGSCFASFLVTLPLPKEDRIEMLLRLLERYQSRREAGTESARTMALVFALDALLDWVIGGKNAPAEELVWATSVIVRGIGEGAGGKLLPNRSFT